MFLNSTCLSLFLSYLFNYSSFLINSTIITPTFTSTSTTNIYSHSNSASDSAFDSASAFLFASP